MEKVVRSQTGGGENLRRLPSGRNYSACLPQDRSIIAPILSLFSVSLSLFLCLSFAFFSFLDSNVTVVSSSRLMHEYRTRPVSRSQLRHRAKCTIINGERANLHCASLALFYVTLTRPPFAFSPAARSDDSRGIRSRASCTAARTYIVLTARRRLESHRSLPALHPLTFSFLSRAYVSIYTRTRHAGGYRSRDAELCHLPPVAAHFRSRETETETRWQDVGRREKTSRPDTRHSS